MSNANAVSVGLFKKLPYDPVKDFAPITTLGYFDLGLFVAPNSRFANLKALLDFAQANPGKLNVGTIAPGSTQHLSAKLFETVAGIDVLIVPYKGSPAVLTALRAGEIDVAFEIAGPMVPQVQAGVVAALAVSSDQRNPALPDVPTAAQAGLPGYNVASWNALAAPAGTPPDVLAALGKAARDAVASAAVREQARQARHAGAGQHAGRAARAAGRRDPALGRRDPRGQDRARIGREVAHAGARAAAADYNSGPRPSSRRIAARSACTGALESLRGCGRSTRSWPGSWSAAATARGCGRPCGSPPRRRA